MQSIVLYHTLGCHLCELAKEQISPLLTLFDTALLEIDIADDEDLLQKYGVTIPVVAIKNVDGVVSDNNLGWPFDTEKVYQWLMQHQLNAIE